MKDFKRFIICILISYLIISALYILFHINFFEEPEITGPGFSESNNVLRLFMGIPKTYSTYEGVSPLFLIEVIIKIIIAIVLIKHIKVKKEQ